MTTSDLDPDALEAATVAVRNATGLFADPWGNITPSEEANWHSSGHYSTDRNRAEVAIRAYLTAREPGVTGKGEG